MSDLLKEAIADAKAVRETALQNAKMALEEAFTPQLKNMLSAKLKEDEFEDEEEFGGEDEFEDEEEIPAEEGSYYEDEEFGDEEGEEIPGEEGGEENPYADEEGDEEVEEEGLELEDIIRELESELSEDEAEEAAPVVDETIEVNGVRYAPIKESEEDEAVEEGASDNPSGEADPDGPNNPAGEGREMKESADEEVDIDESALTEEDEDTVDEQSSSSGIGNGTGVKVATGADEEDPGKGSDTPLKGQKMESVQAELAEYKEAVVFLKDKLHEVNILNAKLLFTNKLFKEFALDNNQKLKVVETFDRAQSTREIKLVYSTLAEQFSDNGSINRKSINESASSAVSSTKPSKASRKVITEEEEVANRFKKLAGLIKG